MSCRIQRMLAGIVLPLAALALGCTAAPRPAGPPALRVHPDPGPLFERQAGVLEPVQRPSLELAAVAKLEREGVVYVEAALPSSERAGGGNLFLTLLAPATGAAFVEKQGTGARLLVRLASKAPAVTLTARQAAGSAPGVQQSWIVNGIETAPTSAPALEERFFAAAAEWFEQQGGRSRTQVEPFYKFVANRLRWIANGRPASNSEAALQMTRHPRPELGELMALYSGLLSVEEALQADRGLLLRNTGSRAAIPLSALEPVPLATHPWQEMLAELKQAPAIEPLAHRVPADALYLHFHDLRTLVLLMKEWGAWATPLAQALEGKAGATHFVERYETQLAIEQSGLAEALGHVAAKGVAMVASDPFLREGSDVALLFHVRTESLLDRGLSLYETRAKQRRPDAVVSTYEVDGIKVRLLATADREIEQHRFTIEDVLVLASSRAAVASIVAVSHGKKSSLADSLDFQYMRALYPFAAEAEDGFAFLGDAFVAHATSPRVKVLQARRMQAQADLAAVGYSALLFGWLNGRAPQSTEELLASGLLDPSDLVHADGAPISFAPGRGASSRWGRLGALVPLAELPLDKVSEEEQRAYERFASTYESYWRGYIDPIAARLRRSSDGKRIEIDARMLPLIDGSQYDSLIEMVGAAALESKPLLGGAALSFAVGQQARLRREANAASRKLSGSTELGVDWLGEWVMVGAADRSGLWDAALLSGQLPECSRPRLERQRNKSRDAVLSRSPLFVAAEVANPAALAGTLMALRSFAESTAPGLLVWQPDVPYRDLPVTTISEPKKNEQPAHEWARYATVQGIFVAALERATLETVIDLVLDGGLAPLAASVAEGVAPTGDAPQAMLSLRPRRSDSWLVRVLAGAMEKAVFESQRVAWLGALALSQAFDGLPEPEVYRRLSLAYLGYEPQSPHGGRFTMHDGFLTHSEYGSPIAPRLPELFVPGAVTDVLASTSSLEMGLGFTNEGKHRGLRARLVWERR